MATPEHSGQNHASIPTYLAVAAILIIITIIEVAIFNVDIPGEALILIMVVLSIAKFALVVMFFMHLRYEHRLFSSFFTGGLILAIGVALGLIALFSNFDIEESNASLAPKPTPTPTAFPTPTPATSAPTLTPVGGSTPTSQPSGQEGIQVFMSKGCGGCHTVTGLAGANGQVGPDLTHIATTGAESDPSQSAEQYIRTSIETPGSFVTSGFPNVMPPSIRQSMSDAEFEALVEYLLSLK